MIGFPVQQVGLFFVPFFRRFVFNNGQYKRVMLEEIKRQLDYSPTGMTIKSKMTFCSIKINKA